MPLSVKHDYRFDPFTKADNAIDISSEEQAVPSNTPYYIDMEEVPRENSPSSITAYDVTDGLTLSEVSGTPASGEFDVDYEYETGKIRFNAAQAGNTIRFDYKGTGHVIAGTFINILSDWLGKNYTVEDDHDHDGVNSKTAIASKTMFSQSIDDISGAWEVTGLTPTTVLRYKIYIPAEATAIEVYAYAKNPEGSNGRIKVTFDATDETIISMIGAVANYEWIHAADTLTINAAIGVWAEIIVQLYNDSAAYTVSMQSITVCYK